METRTAFDAGTAVEPAGEGRWRGRIDPGWNVGMAPNGGYLVALGLSAIGRAVPHPDPVAVSAHFPSRARSSEGVEIEVEPVRAGRSYSTAAARLIQDGSIRVHVTATYGDLAAATGPSAVTEERPVIVPPEDCIRAEGEAAPEFVRRFDLLFTPESAAWATGRPSGRAEMSGWIRFADGREPDAAALAVFADAFPPTVFNLFPTGWVPTLELTVHVRGRPAAGWLQCRFRTRYLIDGYLEEDGEIWDSTGRLVALSRQLARVLG